MTPSAFITKYTGWLNLGDTDQNKGQCVGLIEVWTDTLGLAHTWGNAKDLPAMADRGTFDVYYSGIPQPGDIFCFDGTYGNGLGHTGMVAAADANGVTLFQQNDPTGSTPHLKTYSYAHMAGFLHPKVLTEDQEMTVQAQDIRNLWPNLFQAPPSQSDIDTWTGKSFQDFMYGVVGGPAYQAEMTDFANWKALGIKLSSTPSAQVIEQIKQLVN